MCWTGADILQSKNPVNAMSEYLNSFHFYADDMGRQVEANHFCTHLTEDFLQCVILECTWQQNAARMSGVSCGRISDTVARAGATSCIRVGVTVSETGTQVAAQRETTWAVRSISAGKNNVSKAHHVYRRRLPTSKVCGVSRNVKPYPMTLPSPPTRC